MARHDLEIGLYSSPKSSYDRRLETIIEDAQAENAAYMAELLIDNNPESSGVFEYLNKIHPELISRKQRKDIYPQALQWADKLADEKEFYVCEKALTIAYECATTAKQRDEAFALHLEIAREAADADLEEYGSDATGILKNALRLANKRQNINPKRVKKMTSVCLGLAKECLQNNESSISSDILILAMDGFEKEQPQNIRAALREALREPNEPKRIQMLGEIERLNNGQGKLWSWLAKAVGSKKLQQETEFDQASR